MWGEIKVAVGENRVRNICSFFFVQSEKRKGIFHFSEYNFFFFFFFLSFFWVWAVRVGADLMGLG
jgi:hypothetical protein